MSRVDIDALLADPNAHIVLCCGAGGVGKTTVSAAVAVRAAEAGRRVVVMTIDPAKRLATSLGLDQLGHEPQAVDGIDRSAGGSLDAMMLDMKRTFDDAIRAHATEAQAEQLLRNPFYEALSTSFSGTQEYMAMEKLGELYTSGLAGTNRRWDLIVVDTPPSASALDFLDAPDRLGRLLEGGMMRAVMAPARGGLRFIGAGMRLLTPVLNAIIGGQALRDLQTFVEAFDSVLGGFRERAAATRATLSSPHTSCLVVATPEPSPLHEAALLARRLHDDAIRLRGVVVNRVATPWPPLSEAQPDGLDEATRWAFAAHANRAELRAAQRRAVVAALPDVAITAVPMLNAEITDIETLRRCGAHVAGDLSVSEA